MTTAQPAILSPRRPRTLKVFAWGLGVRLVGAGMVWAGDGHRHWFSKVVVVIGVALSIGGIGILKWLSMRPRGGRRQRPAGTEAEWRSGEGRVEAAGPRAATTSTATRGRESHPGGGDAGGPPSGML